LDISFFKRENGATSGWDLQFQLLVL